MVSVVQTKNYAFPQREYAPLTPTFSYGQPSVVFYAQTKSGSPISHIYTFHGLHMFITVSEDNTITLWELSSEGSLSVSPTQEFKLDPEG